LHIVATPGNFLTWSADPTNLTLTWMPGGTLQVSTNLNTPAAWQDLNTNGIYTERMTNKTRFFRLKN
jgi:hypothetical protein